ncbi:EscU/YscU/HrcU family type III secretion system export apparatus switch protein [Spongiibacter sp.]|uniref:EscU/YscU/HrcU family type III secretion system export apparatus switch protein n=1 Tax=Spongiibacter sp. TaxID=2024860 RepID=UPI003568D8C0
MKESPAQGTMAVSLHYDGESAPTLSAKGEGEIARRILELANEHDVPIYQDEQLLRLLSRVELDEEIPEMLYIAVAEVIAFAYRLKDKLPQNYYYQPGGENIYEQGSDD